LKVAIVYYLRKVIRRKGKILELQLVFFNAKEYSFNDKEKLLKEGLNRFKGNIMLFKGEQMPFSKKVQ